MSTEDKLAETIRTPYDARRHPPAPHQVAAARVREAFVVIDRDDLPKGDVSPGGVRVEPGFFPPPEPADKYLAVGLRYLAAHEYYKANPPVDEKAVLEMALSLDKAFVETGTFDTRARNAAARALVAGGWKRGGVS